MSNNVHILTIKVLPEYTLWRLIHYLKSSQIRRLILKGNVARNFPRYCTYNNEL
jgi:hypothetical protein